MLPDRATDNNAALDQAWMRLRATDPSKVASSSWSKQRDGTIVLPFFESELVVSPRESNILEKGEKVDALTAILAMHYLLGCGPESPSGKLVTFNQAIGGELYYSAFKRRAIDKLADLFGPDPGKLIGAGSAIGGEAAGIGSASVLLHAFPKVPVTIVVWEGDEEILASANILFDEVVLSILPTEDLAVIGSLTVSRLKRALG